MMPVKFLFVAALTGLMLLAGPVLAESGARSLTDVVVSGDERTVDLRLNLENNMGKPLGKVYYSGDSIRILIEDTTFTGKGITRYDSDDSLVKRVEVHPQARSVSLLIHLTKRVGSIMERIVFTPGNDHSLITFRKDAFYEQPQAQTPVQAPLPVQAQMPAQAETPTPERPASAAAPLPLVEIPPLVAPQELAQIPPLPQPDPATPDELLALREQTLSQLLDPEAAAGPDPEQEAPAVAAVAEENTGRIEGVGVNMPDLTNLYIMTGMVLLVAALWFGLMRGRRVGFAAREEALKVVKAHNLGGKQRLMVVEAEGRRLLLSATDKEVRLLTELDTGHSAEDALNQAVKSEKVRYLFNDAAQSGSPAVAGSRPAPRTRSERPAYFGNSGTTRRSFGGSSTPAAASDEDALRDKLRGLRRKG